MSTELKQEFSYIKNVFWVSSGKFVWLLAKLLSIFMAEEKGSVVSKPSPLSDILSLLYQKEKYEKKKQPGEELFKRSEQEFEKIGKTGEPEAAKSSWCNMLA